MSTLDDAGPDALALAPGEIDDSFVLARLPSVATVEIDGESVLFDGASGSLHLLDPVGAIVWSCLDGSATLDELTTDLSDAFGAEPAQVRADVVELARDLFGRGLLHALPDGTAPSGAEPASLSSVSPDAATGADVAIDADVEEPRFLERPASL